MQADLDGRQTDRKTDSKTDRFSGSDSDRLEQRDRKKQDR